MTNILKISPLGEDSFFFKGNNLSYSFSTDRQLVCYGETPKCGTGTFSGVPGQNIRETRNFSGCLTFFTNCRNAGFWSFRINGVAFDPFGGPPSCPTFAWRKGTINVCIFEDVCKLNIFDNSVLVFSKNYRTCPSVSVKNLTDCPDGTDCECIHDGFKCCFKKENGIYRLIKKVTL